MRVLCAWLRIAAAGCGDGGTPPTESCAVTGDEDGNGLADCDDPACAGVCRPVCGNGKLEMGEGCDDGNKTSGDGCDTNCMVSGCGNGLRAPNERCDDGNTTSGDGCDNNCTPTACGNGVRTTGERCDDGNATSGDGCDSNCTPTACGNGVLTAGERCDDGNAIDGDGCDHDCTLTACGNGIVTAGEGCDDGNLADGDGCDHNCTPTACGNGVRTAGEACDDGNLVDGDGCDRNCKLTGCGNGIVTAGEGCDDGNLVDGDGCDRNCKPTGCGNGIVTTGEECDDGNLVDGDGCDRNCKPTGCGNGVMTVGERCDDGNLASGDGCDANCTPTGCGNGIITGGEECDDGNTNTADGCTNACLRQVCGDGRRDAPEGCDDGNLASGDGCDANCTPTACGNGIVTTGEACDDANAIAFDGCSPTCQAELFEREPNEDGSVSTGGSGIAGNDFATANANANGAFTGPVTFGAAISPAGDEDVFLFSNPSTSPQVLRVGLWSTALGLGVSCGSTIDTGLQIRDAAGTVLSSNDDRSSADLCSSSVVGLMPGASVYAHVVDYDDNSIIPGYIVQATYTASTCGNGIAEFGEECDDGNTAAGDGCDATCRIDRVCGDGLIAPGEQCDDGNAAPGDGCGATCQVETTPELEPNNSTIDAAGSPLQITGDATISGSLATGGDVDIYRLAVASSTVIRFETFTSIYDCRSTPISLALLNQFQTQIISDTSGLGAGSCGSIVVFLAPGTYFVRVSSGSFTAVSSYFLAVDYQIDRGAEPEPGNTSGVNDTTGTASTNLVGGRDAYVFGDHMRSGDIDFYAITVPGGSRIRIELIEGDRPVETCESLGIASRLTLFDQTLAMVADATANGRGACSLIDGTGSAPLHSGARNRSTAPQTYYLMVSNAPNASTSAAAFIYRLQVSFR